MKTNDASYWRREIEASGRREREWRDNASSIYKIYRGQNKKKNSFNILWANTEILRPSIFNSTPQPDVRRRFRDDDKLGKAVSEVLQRSLEVNMDYSGFDAEIERVVLDSLLLGRGVTRIRYEPVMRGGQASESSSSEDAPSPELNLDYESVCPQHVDWEDYRQGYGRSWGEVEWVAFRHRLTKSDAIDRFGDVIGEIEFSEQRDDDDGAKSDETSPAKRTAEFWEVWDRAKRRVFFIQTSYIKGLLFPLDNPKGEPPLDLERFFPLPEPLRLIEDSSSQIPTPMYNLYRQQADELDRITNRINVVVQGLKLRGVYDATLTELSNLMSAEDNLLIAASKAAAYMANGGLEKAIWWMPTEKAAMVLRELYVARDACKQVIYEISGVSDILRGATSASETATAQEIKANYATVRLKRMQKLVERHVRDVVRLMSEVIGNKFEIQTLQASTGLQYLTNEQKLSAQSRASMLSAQQQPIPELLQQALMRPTWEEIIGVLRSDAMRCYVVDVETDSTVAATLEMDMKGLREVIGGITEFWNGVGPAVQAGAVPIEVVKEITTVIARRAKMGMAIEDALDKLQQPAAQENTSATENDAALQRAQAELQKQSVDLERGLIEAERKDLELKKREAEISIKEQQFAINEALASERGKINEQIRLAEESISAREQACNESAENAEKQMIQAQEVMADGEQSVSAMTEFKDVMQNLSEAILRGSEILAQVAAKPRLAGMKKIRGSDGSVIQRVPIYEDGSEGSPLTME